MLLLYLCNGYKLHRLKRRIKNSLLCCFCSFFLNPVIFKDRQRKKHHRWDSESIVPAHPEPDPKTAVSCLLDCLLCACVNISICCSHIILPPHLKVSLRIKTVFSEGRDSFGDLLFQFGSIFVSGPVVTDVECALVTGSPNQSNGLDVCGLKNSQKLYMRW